jgi:hypothetical protein
MIVCSLQLVSVNDGHVEHLGTIEISNQLLRTMSNPKRGDYGFRLFKKRRQRVFDDGLISDFPRLSYHPWNLVRDILNDVAVRHGGRI